MKMHYDFSRGKRGAMAQTPPGKTRITIRIDDDVLDWFRKKVHEMGGGNYQSLMNTALREHMMRSEQALEETLKRILREELPKYEIKKKSMKARRIPRSKHGPQRRVDGASRR